MPFFQADQGTIQYTMGEAQPTPTVKEYGPGIKALLSLSKSLFCIWKKYLDFA